MAGQAVCKKDEIPTGYMKQLIFDDEEIAVYHLPDGWFATSDVCTHGRAFLTEGSLDGCIVTCPRHGGQFNVMTGAAVKFPCVSPLQVYSVNIRDEEVWVDCSVQRK